MTTGTEANDGAASSPPERVFASPPEHSVSAQTAMMTTAAATCGATAFEGGESKVSGEQQGKGKSEISGLEKAAVVVVDVSSEGGGEWNADAEKLCRICHLSPDAEDLEGSEFIQIGCSCKGELGTAHRRCAEAWFRLKGNRCCEICGGNAKNIIGEEDSSFTEAWHQRRMLGNSTNRNALENGSCWSQLLCHFLILLLLLVAYILTCLFIL